MAGFLWEYTGSNRGPSACKADALNQLSYTPNFIQSKPWAKTDLYHFGRFLRPFFQERGCKYRHYFNFKKKLTALLYIPIKPVYLRPKLKTHFQWQNNPEKLRRSSVP
jgi:hypothetical protein